MLEIRLDLKAGSFGIAHDLADSTLRWYPNPQPSAALELASLAGLLGQREILLKLLAIGAPSMPFVSPQGVPVQPSTRLAETALQLVGYALLGGSNETVSRLETDVERLVGASARVKDRFALRGGVLAAPAELGFPLFGARPFHNTKGGGYLIDLQTRFARGDTGGVRASFASIEKIRGASSVVPSQMGLEAFYQESWLRLAIGDSVVVINGLDTMLEFLEGHTPAAFQTIQGPASLARRWATAVVELWGGADEGVPVDIAAMKRIATQGHE
jgi:hypothetical protein